MKKLSKNILKKISLAIIILFITVVPIFSIEMVPKEDFDEVLNQLIISNEILSKVQESNVKLQEVLDIQEKDFSAELIKKDSIIRELSSENTALREKINILENEKEEILAQLIISNETIKKLNDSNSSLTTALDDCKRRLEESNRLLVQDVKFSLGGNATIINGSLGFGVDFSYLIFKNMSLDVGLGYSYPTNLVPRLGISILW
jgi:vacuolar-type H+-ATPase subunit I/STV1